DVFNMGPGLTSLEFVTVGNAGNAADTTGYGSVAYEYRMGTYEVTNAQYVEFLNAVAAESDPKFLYKTGLGSNPRYGMVRSDVAGGGYSYAVRADMANKPVIRVNQH